MADNYGSVLQIKALQGTSARIANNTTSANTVVASIGYHEEE